MVVELIYKDISYKLRGCLFSVYNELGPGFKEIVYHDSLALEFNEQGINFIEHPELPVAYKGRKVGVYRPDFVMEDKIVIEIKAQEELKKLHELQLYYYLKASGYKLGFLVNFGGSELQILRRIFSKDPR